MSGRREPGPDLFQGSLFSSTAPRQSLLFAPPVPGLPVPSRAAAAEVAAEVRSQRAKPMEHPFRVGELLRPLVPKNAQRTAQAWQPAGASGSTDRAARIRVDAIGWVDGRPVFSGHVTSSGGQYTRDRSLVDVDWRGFERAPALRHT